MSRNRSQHRSKSPDTPATRKTAELLSLMTKLLCKEDVFPKRTHWVIGYKLMDLLNDFETCVNRANGTPVVTKGDRDNRHEHLMQAIANLVAIDEKVTRAQRDLSIPVEKFQGYGDLVYDLRKLLLAWEASDTRRYGAPTPLKIPEGDGR